jgi:predicted phosphate transport protein (TIGR00153 family)
MWTRTAARGRLPFALEAEVAMKLRIFSREESFFDLFEAAADNMAQAARLLDDLLGDFVDPELKAKRLVEREHEGDRITHAILTRLNSTFITPFDREDIYALAAQLDDVVDAVEEAADMLVLHKVAEPIEPVREQARIILQAAEETARGLRHLRKLNLVRLRAYQVAVTELEEEGDRVYRRARAELYTFTGEHPARYVLVWKDIVEQLEEALDSLDHVTHTVEGIVLTYA